MQQLDTEKLHDMLTRYFSNELKNTLPDASSMISQSADRTTTIQVILPKTSNPETELKKINLDVSRFMRKYIVEVLETSIGQVNRNVTFYETEIKENMIFFKWMF